MLEIDLAGLDLGEVQELVDQEQQGLAGGLHRIDIGGLLRGERGVEQQAAHADDAVERRADFMGRHGQEARLGAIGRIGEVPGVAKRTFGFGPVGDVAPDALHFRRPVGVDANEALAPGDPARSERAPDLLVVDAGAVRFQRRVTLFEHRKIEDRTQQLAAGFLRQRAEGLVGEGNALLGVAQHDQVALRFEQAACALLRFLQLPIAVDQGLVARGDSPHRPAQHADPEAQGRQRDTSECEQAAEADCEHVRIVGVGAATDDEAIDAAERGGEDRERAQQRRDPRMLPLEAADSLLDP